MEHGTGANAVVLCLHTDTSQCGGEKQIKTMSKSHLTLDEISSSKQAIANIGKGRDGELIHY